jgi:hypothetical protein
MLPGVVPSTVGTTLVHVRATNRNGWGPFSHFYALPALPAST